MPGDDMPVFGIYRDDSGFCIRRMHSLTESYWPDPFQTLEEARAALVGLERNLHQLARDPADDPSLVEVWL
jgi:hypothetical protein